MQVTIITKSRADYDAAFNACVGDSKNNMTYDSYNWIISGTMTASDYNDLYQTLTHRIPAYPITITCDDVVTVIDYDYDDNDNEWITINGIRQ